MIKYTRYVLLEIEVEAPNAGHADKMTSKLMYKACRTQVTDDSSTMRAKVKNRTRISARSAK